MKLRSIRVYTWSIRGKDRMSEPWSRVSGTIPGESEFFSPWCCATLFWPNGPCIQLSPLWAGRRVGRHPPSTYTPSNRHGRVGFCLDVSLHLQSSCVVETTRLLVFETPTSFNQDSILHSYLEFSALVYLFLLVLDFLQNRCPHDRASRTIGSW